MIELKNLALNIENALNGLIDLNGQSFKIFADLGDFKHYYKPETNNDVTRYINGIMESFPPTILPIRNLQVTTQSARITFALDIELLNKDEYGNYVEVTEIKRLLASYIAQTNGRPTVMSDAIGTTFEVTPSFNGITVGEITQLSPIGEMLPLYLDLSYTIIESGINSNSVEIFVNRENLYFEKIGIARTRVAETNTYAGEKTTKTTIQNNGISFDIMMPLIDTPQGNKIEDDIMKGGNNEAQLVQYKRGGKIYNYIMVFGNNDLNLEIAKNIGTKISLVEGKPDVLEYSNNWTYQVVNVVAGQTVTIGTEVDEFDGVAFFGDGESASSDTGIFTHTYEKAGTYIVRIFDLYRMKVVNFYVDDVVYESESVSFGGYATRPEINPQKDGYTFVDWYDSQNFTTLFDFDAPIETNKEVYAKFNIVTYSISYVIPQGTNNPLNPSSYNIETPTIVFESPTANAGYEFAGFYRDENFEIEIGQITQGSTGDYTIYAKFDPTPYILTIDSGINTNIVVERLQSPIGNAFIGILENQDIVYYTDALKVTYEYTGSSNDYILIMENGSTVSNNSYSKNTFVGLGNVLYSVIALEAVEVIDRRMALNYATNGGVAETIINSQDMLKYDLTENKYEIKLDADFSITFYDLIDQRNVTETYYASEINSVIQGTERGLIFNLADLIPAERCGDGCVLIFEANLGYLKITQETTAGRTRIESINGSVLQYQ